MNFQAQPWSNFKCWIPQSHVYLFIQLESWCKSQQRKSRKSSAARFWLSTERVPSSLKGWKQINFAFLHSFLGGEVKSASFACWASENTFITHCSRDNKSGAFQMYARQVKIYAWIYLFKLAWEESLRYCEKSSSEGKPCMFGLLILKFQSVIRSCFASKISYTQEYEITLRNRPSEPGKKCRLNFVFLSALSWGGNFSSCPNSHVWANKSSALLLDRSTDKQTGERGWNVSLEFLFYVWR